MSNSEIIAKLSESFNFSAIEERHDIIYANLQDRDLVIQTLQKLRDEFQFQVITDLFAVDYPNRVKRFDLIYNLLSFQKNARICLRIELAEDESIMSATSVFSGADWYEREAFDMFGINFENHPDLRRILTDYGFQGNPLRKDFPLTGYVEVRYDQDQEKVVYEPVSLSQDYRTFDFESPWEGMEKELPGDEKAEKNEEKA